MQYKIEFVTPEEAKNFPAGALVVKRYRTYNNAGILNSGVFFHVISYFDPCLIDNIYGIHNPKKPRGMSFSYALIGDSWRRDERGIKKKDRVLFRYKQYGIWKYGVDYFSGIDKWLDSVGFIIISS